MQMCSDCRKTNTEPGKIDEPRAKEQHFGKRQAEYKFYILQLTKVYFSKKQNHTSQMRMFKKKIIYPSAEEVPPTTTSHHILVFKVKKAAE